MMSQIPCKQSIRIEMTGWFKPVVLKLVGSIEPNRCHASIHRTLNSNQERIQKILEGVCSFELG